MKRNLTISCVALLLSTASLPGQIGVTHISLESKVAEADLIIRGKALEVVTAKKTESWVWLQVTLEVNEALKGKAEGKIKITTGTSTGNDRWKNLVESGEEQLFFLVNSDRYFPGENPKGAEVIRKHPYKPIRYWSYFPLKPKDKDQFSYSDPPGLFTMDFEIPNGPELLAAARRIIATEPKKRPGYYSMMIPQMLAQRTGHRGDANSFNTPNDSRLEKLARRLIATPEEVLPKANEMTARTARDRRLNENWLRFSANRLREEGAKALVGFKSEENIEILKGLLDHPAKVGSHGIEEKEFFVRRAAVDVLAHWKVEFDRPVLVEGRDSRHPKTDEELRYWLENMLWHHRYQPIEVAAAIDLEPDQLDNEKERFKIYWNTKPKRPADSPLLVLPYPGGRHPRLGFCEGAIHPQRETKVSVFTPWNEESYVVVDIPEAIWSNLGLTYLAHSHIPTIWTKQGIQLEKLEWNRHENGTLDMQRKLPNGIEFGTRVMPERNAVRMEMWLKNGTKEKLTGLRVQNCVMLKKAFDFSRQTNDNKVFRKPYAAVRNDEGTRWIITAWDHCDRTWGNEKCPCLHSDPRFPDCAPGETQRLKGWLSFYQGKDLDGELDRIEKTGWRK